MPTPITGLPGELTTLADNDLFVVDDTSEVETKKITAANLRTALGAGFDHIWTEGGSVTLPDRNTVVDVGDTASLTLPAASDGRVYIIRLLSPTRAITLVPQSGDIIDFTPGNRVLPGGISAGIGITDVSEDPLVWIVTGMTGDGPAWHTSTVAGRSVTTDEAPSSENDSTQGFCVGTIWRQVIDEVTVNTWICLDATEDEAVWHRLGTGDGTSDGWTGTSSSATTISPTIPGGGLLLRVIAATAPTINLPAGVNGMVLVITQSGDTAYPITAQPSGSDTISAYSVVGVGGATSGASGQAMVLPYSRSTGGYRCWILAYNGRWDLVSPQVPRQGAIPNAAEDFPDVDVILFHPFDGDEEPTMPPVTVGIPRVTLVKKKNTVSGMKLILHPSGAEKIEDSTDPFEVPDSDSADMLSWTFYRDVEGNWWLL